MARGKYAARAANARAGEAQQSAAQMRDLLAAERTESARKIAELNGRIAQLQGRLDREVKALSEAEVERVRTDFASTLASERAHWRARALKVGKILDGITWRLSERESIAELLDVPLGELFQQGASSTRINRRMTGSKARAVASEIEQARTRGLTFHAKVAGALPDTAMDAAEEHVRAELLAEESCEPDLGGGGHGTR